jgi:multiple sugar transport system substrate-binding protein
MTKKILNISGIIIILGVIVFLLFNKKNEGEQAGKVNIFYWLCMGQKEDIPYPVAAFNRQQNEIQVEAVSIPWQEQEKKVLTAILSGNPPDIVSQFVPVAKWASRMALMPLDKFIERDNYDLSIYFEDNLKEMKWQNHIFALPISTASYAFFYNKRLFREVGLDPEKPPKTWDEVKAISKRFDKKNSKGQLVRTGFFPFFTSSTVASQMTSPTAMLMAWEKGANFLVNNGTKVCLSSPEIIEPLQWIADYYSDYSLDEVSAFVAGFGYADQHCFVSEKMAMMVLSSTFPEHIERYHPDLDYGISMIPTFEGCPIASSSGCFWVAIPRGTKHPEEAWEFIKYMMSKEVQIKTVEAMEENLFPSNKRAVMDKRFLKDENTKIFVKHLEVAHSPSIIPMAHDVFWREFYSAQERIVYGIQSIEKSLKQAEQIIQRELDFALDYDRYVRSKMGFNEN